LLFFFFAFCILLVKLLIVACWHYSAAFLRCQDIICSPHRTKIGCQVSPLLLNFFFTSNLDKYVLIGTDAHFFFTYNLDKYVLIGTDAHLTCLILSFQCGKHLEKAIPAMRDSH
jgi:hypothetical protein